MEIIKKHILEFLAQQEKPVTIQQIQDKLTELDCPNIPQQTIFDVLDSISILLNTNQNKKIKGEKDQDNLIQIKESVKLKLLEIDRIQFYITKNNKDDQDTLYIIQKIYEIIVKSGESGIPYKSLSERFNSLQQKQKKLQINQISHYCRKLFSLGFIYIKTKEHFKIAISTIYSDPDDAKTEKRKFNIQEAQPTERKIRNLQEEDVQSFQGKQKDLQDLSKQFKTAFVMDQNDSKEQELSSEYSNKAFYFREATFLQNLSINLSGYEAYDKEGLYLYDVQSRLNKVEEKKSLSRLFETLRSNKQISQIADRQGKILSYRYLIRNQNHNFDKQKKVALKIEHTVNQQIKVNHPDQGQQDENNISCLEIIEINRDAFQDLIECIQKYDNQFLKGYKMEQSYQERTDYTLGFINKISKKETNDEKTKRKKNQDTRQRFNRLSIIINMIHEMKIIKQKDIRDRIKSDEVDNQQGVIDGRTMQLLLEKLLIIEFCYSVMQEVYIANKMCKRYLYVHFKIPQDDQTLKMEIESLHILNPPPKNEKKMVESSEDSESQSREIIRRENKRIKRYEIIEHIRQNQNIQKEDIYHSDNGSEKKIGQNYELISKSKINRTKCFKILFDIIEQNLKLHYKQLIIQLKIKYAIYVMNYQFSQVNKQQIVLLFCDQLEQQIKNNQLDQISYSFDQWEEHTIQIAKENSKKFLPIMGDSEQFLLNIGASSKLQLMNFKSLNQSIEQLKYYLLKKDIYSLRDLENRFPLATYFIFKGQNDETIMIYTDKYLDTVIKNNKELIERLENNQNDLYIKIEKSYFQYFY